MSSSSGGYQWSRYAQRPKNASKESAIQPECQNCYNSGHWTYECKNEKVVLSRPSQSQLLKDPTLKHQNRPNLDDVPDIPLVTDGDMRRDVRLQKRFEERVKLTALAKSLMGNDIVRLKAMSKGRAAEGDDSMAGVSDVRNLATRRSPSNDSSSSRSSSSRSSGSGSSRRSSSVSSSRSSYSRTRRNRDSSRSRSLSSVRRSSVSRSRSRSWSRRRSSSSNDKHSGRRSRISSSSSRSSACRSANRKSPNSRSSKSSSMSRRSNNSSSSHSSCGNENKMQGNEKKDLISRNNKKDAKQDLKKKINKDSPKPPQTNVSSL